MTERDALQVALEALGKQRLTSGDGRTEIATKLGQVIYGLRSDLAWERKHWPASVARALGIGEADMGRTPTMAETAVHRALIAHDEEIATFRRALWLLHGHDGLYGDDGEMQCSLCMRSCHDYKRGAAADVVKAATKAIQERSGARNEKIAALEGAWADTVEALERSEAKRDEALGALAEQQDYARHYMHERAAAREQVRVLVEALADLRERARRCPHACVSPCPHDIRMGSAREFADAVLARVKEAGRG